MSRPLDVVCRPTDDGFACEVTVGDDPAATRHHVHVSRAAFDRLTPGHDEPTELVRASFEFLLAREPREAILGAFELPVIERYFPGYESEIRQQLAR